MPRPLFIFALALLLSTNGYAQGTSPISEDLNEVRLSEPDERLTYKTTAQGKLRLHVYYPEDHDDDAEGPAIVLFHGGGWVSGDPEQFYPHAQHFASRGMIAISAEYRTRDTHGTTPFESVRDGVSAMRWVRTHAQSLGISPDSIVAGGGSAGGHIAAATALLDGFDDPDEDLSVDARPNALVLFNPVIDNGPDGYGYERIGGAYRSFSPLHNVSSDAPPTLFLSGTKDHIVPVSTIHAFQLLMREAGVRCEVVLYEGQGHGFFNYRNGANPYYTRTICELERFLSSLGYL